MRTRIKAARKALSLTQTSLRDCDLCNMQFEWDEAKRFSNLTKHKIDFIDAVTIYNDFVVTTESPQGEHGEPRFVSIGLLRGLEIVIVFTPREDKRRIISVRRARLTERNKYHEERKRKQDGL
jgi:uncharacterized DUF497 family protein